MTPTPNPDPYIRLAQDWWTEHHPTELVALPNQPAFFSTIANHLRDAIEATQAELQANLPEDLDYLDRVAAIRQTQIQAEELTLAEWFPVEGGTPRVPTLNY